PQLEAEFLTLVDDRQQRVDRLEEHVRDEQGAEKPAQLSRFLGEGTREIPGDGHECGHVERVHPGVDDLAAGRADRAEQVPHDDERDQDGTCVVDVRVAGGALSGSGGSGRFGGHPGFLPWLARRWSAVWGRCTRRAVAATTPGGGGG